MLRIEPSPKTPPTLDDDHKRTSCFVDLSGPLDAASIAVTDFSHQIRAPKAQAPPVRLASWRALPPCFGRPSASSGRLGGNLSVKIRVLWAQVARLRGATRPGPRRRTQEHLCPHRPRAPRGPNLCGTLPGPGWTSAIASARLTAHALPLPPLSHSSQAAATTVVLGLAGPFSRVQQRSSDGCPAARAVAGRALAAPADRRPLRAGAAARAARA